MIRSDPKYLEAIRILLAEDAQDIQLLFSRMLTRHGASVVTANNGSEALKKFYEQDFDIILLDIQMPILDGYQTAIKMRQIGCDKPIIALSAHGIEEIFPLSKAAGFDDYLSKPVELNQLIDKVHEHTKHFSISKHKQSSSSNLISPKA